MDQISSESKITNKCDISKIYRSLIVKCKCGGNYCLKQRYTFYLNCTFVYMSYEREKIKQNNPVVVQDKIKNRMKSGDFNSSHIFNTMKNIDYYVTDNSPVVDKYLIKYDKKFTH